MTEAFLVKLLNFEALDDVGSPGDRICLIDEVASVEYLMEKIVIREIIKDEEPWSSVVLRVRSSCLQIAASFRHAAQRLMIAHEIIVLLEDGRGSELERTISKSIYPLVMVVNIEAH